MRLIAQPLVPNYRLARILTWARLWLVWAAAVLRHFVGALPTQYERDARAHLERYAAVVAQVIFLCAFSRLAPPASSRRTKAQAARRRYVSMRALLGSALRRALRGKDARAKLIALASVVQHAERHIAALTRRLAQSLTRRLLFTPTSELASPALAASCAQVLRVDTS